MQREKKKVRKKVRGAEGKGRREKGERKLENAEERERERIIK